MAPAIISFHEMKLVPISTRVAWTLPSIGIDKQFLNSTNVTMESEKYICVTETSPDQNSVVIIHTSMPMQARRHSVTYDSALMHPDGMIIALKGQTPRTTEGFLEIYSFVLKGTIKWHPMPEQVVFWKWITPEKLGLVTQTSVYHWSKGDAASEPTKMFDRATNLANSQIINYRCDLSEKWLVLIGTEPGVSERRELVKGNMQLFSVDNNRSEDFEAHAASFASFRVAGNDNDSIILCYASKTMKDGKIKSKLHVTELGAEQETGFSKKANLRFETGFDDDYPLAMEISRKYGLIYVISKRGLLFVNDLATTHTICNPTISQYPIFLTSEASSVGGIYAINTKGEVLVATIDEASIVPYVSVQLDNLELAINLARRGGLPRTRNLDFLEIVSELQSFLRAGKWENESKAAKIRRESLILSILLMYAEAYGSVPETGTETKITEMNNENPSLLLSHVADGRAFIDDISLWRLSYLSDGRKFAEFFASKDYRDGFRWKSKGKGYVKDSEYKRMRYYTK